MTVDPPVIRQRLRDLITLQERELAKVCGQRMGVILFAFDLGERGMMHYVSNAERDDCITALLEWVGKQSPELLTAAIERLKAQAVLGPEEVQ